MNYNRLDIGQMTAVQIFVLQDLLKAMGIEGNPVGTKEECLLAGINIALEYFEENELHSTYTRDTAWEFLGYRYWVQRDIRIKYGRFWHVKITEE